MIKLFVTKESDDDDDEGVPSPLDVSLPGSGARSVHFTSAVFTIFFRTKISSPH